MLKVTGERFEYQNWASGYGKSGNVATLSKQPDNSFWVNTVDHSAAPVIIEWDTSKPKPPKTKE